LVRGEASDAPVAVSAEQWWFHTEEWQAGEREASEEIAAGHTTVCESVEEFVGHLEGCGEAAASSPYAEAEPTPPEVDREGQAVAELATVKTKADALMIAWRALGVVGDPSTGDVVPAVEWLAAHGVRVDRSRAYDVRRRVIARRRVARGPSAWGDAR
jgi:hypothetical protein